MKSSLLFFLISIQISLVSASKKFILKYSHDDHLPVLLFLASVSEDHSRIVISTYSSQTFLQPSPLSTDSSGYSLLQLLTASLPDDQENHRRTLTLTKTGHNIKYSLRSSEGKTLVLMALKLPPEVQALQHSRALLSSSTTEYTGVTVFDALSSDILRTLHDLLIGGVKNHAPEALAIQSSKLVNDTANFTAHFYKLDKEKKVLEWSSKANATADSAEQLDTNIQILIPSDQQFFLSFMLERVTVAYMVIGVCFVFGTLGFIDGL